MASLVVRGLDESVKAGLVEQARRHGRSMEAEVRDILTRAVERPHLGVGLLELGHRLGGVDLAVPERVDEARWVDFE